MLLSPTSLSFLASSGLASPMARLTTAASPSSPRSGAFPPPPPPPYSTSVLATPTIRKPSTFSSSLSRRPRRKPLTPPLPPRALLALRVVLVALVLWFELGTFRAHSSGFFGLGGCKWDDSPSVSGRVWDGSFALASSRGGEKGGWVADDRWKVASQDGARAGRPFHVLVAADPQLLDMRSYPGRSWILRKVGVWITDLYARKSWRAVLGSRGTGGTGLDAVVWLGDLLDNGLDAVDQREHASYIHRFHLLFPLPRASTSSFSALSRSSASSSSARLVPPLPAIVLPGNHDLGLHSPSSSLAAYHRERFAEAFGPTWGEREWNGWRVVWVDAMALLEEEFWTGEGGQFVEMRGWLEAMGRDAHSPSSPPTVLLTHIPLFRPENTPCGRTRESRRPIHQGAGRNYQNELGERETEWLVEKVGPTVVYSGDDHDACVIRHPFVSPLDGTTPVVETTVKAFSMAMGVRSPGYSLLSLYPGLPSSTSPSSPIVDPDAPVSYTYTQTACLLPDQLGIYLHVYLPLFALVLLAFLVPKTATAARASLSRRRNRRVASALANGLPTTAASAIPAGHARTGSKSRLQRAAEEDVALEEAEAQYPGLVGGLAYGDSAASPGGSVLFDQASDDGLSDLEGEILPLSNPGSGASTPVIMEGHGRGASGHVRRVSRVWLWEGTARPSSSSSSSVPSSPPNGPSLAGASHVHARRRSSSAVVRVAHLAIDRLASNSLLAPLARAVLRPVFRLVRGVWRKVLAPVLVLVGGVKGLRGRGGAAGQVVEETVDEVVAVAGWPVGVWVALAVWYSI
ncbi:hypothetical protein JCM8097_008302 [Rhodosporidiobolus ruineniae]